MRMLGGPESASSLPPLTSATRFPEHLASTPVTFGKDSSLAAQPALRNHGAASTSISVLVGNLWESPLFVSILLSLPFSQSFYLTVQKDESYVCFFFNLNFFFNLHFLVLIFLYILLAMSF